jgi:NAD(P)-dependent dehydrogenase (short-subunit alcohol dehydrogenase family)
MSWIENKRVVVTGATSGLGREVALRLGSLGAEVVLACRGRVRGEQVAAAINATAGGERATPSTSTSTTCSSNAVPTTA